MDNLAIADALSTQEQHLVAEAYSEFQKLEEQNVLLADLALKFIARNPRARDAIAVIVFLAAGPSDFLEDLLVACKGAWWDEQAAIFRLETYHGKGVLPPDHRRTFPRPSFVRAA
ncbi:MAG: hypothetical protein DPW14_09610 [Planctomycetes bacterium]|nr:hypothetical protein [Planctomycetota bacterium]